MGECFFWYHRLARVVPDKRPQNSCSSGALCSVAMYSWWTCHPVRVVNTSAQQPTNLAVVQRPLISLWCQVWLLLQLSAVTIFGFCCLWRFLARMNMWSAEIMFIPDFISMEGNAVRSICLSIHLSVCLVPPLSFELTYLWPWPYACVWVMTIDRVRLKVEVISHDHCHNAVSGEWRQFSLSFTFDDLLWPILW